MMTQLNREDQADTQAEKAGKGNHGLDIQKKRQQGQGDDNGAKTRKPLSKTGEGYDEAREQVYFHLSPA